MHICKIKCGNNTLASYGRGDGGTNVKIHQQILQKEKKTIKGSWKAGIQTVDEGKTEGGTKIELRNTQMLLHTLSSSRLFVVENYYKVGNKAETNRNRIRGNRRNEVSQSEVT